MVEPGSVGEISWTRTAPGSSPGAANMASCTCCSALVSRWVTTSPRTRVWKSIAASRSGTARPTWSIPSRPGIPARGATSSGIWSSATRVTVRAGVQGGG